MQSLLAAAEKALATFRLTRPEDDNAYGYYTDVLAIDPENAAAADGFRRIAERYGTLARRELEHDRLSKAGTYVQRGLSVHPKSATLTALEQEIDAAASRRRSETPPAPALEPEPDPYSDEDPDPEIVADEDSNGKPEIVGESPKALYRRIKSWFQ